jgi:hypothetical protein
MRRIITTSLFVAAAAIAVSSCDNGAYTANPKKDQTSTMNPFDNTIANNVLIGTMEGKIDGKTYDLKGYYSVDENNIRTIWARVINDSVFFRTITIVGNNDAFKGKSDVTLTDPIVSITYSAYDTMLKRNKVFMSTNAPTYSAVNIIKDGNDKIWGIVSGKLIREDPPPSDPSDSVFIGHMNFYLEKK